jgi:hypothetical protein
MFYSINFKTFVLHVLFKYLYVMTQLKIIKPISQLTLSLLMSYIYGAPCKARNFNVVYIYYIYMDLCLAMLKAVSFYLLHNVSTLIQCRKFSCVTGVCKHFASYKDYPNYKLDLIR